jgi:hypothetical protein
MPKSKSKCVFNPDWLSAENYKDWLATDGTAIHCARCVLCLKSFDIGAMGKAALKSHMDGGKHKNRVRAVSGTDGKAAPRVDNLRRPASSAAQR